MGQAAVVSGDVRETQKKKSDASRPQDVESVTRSDPQILLIIFEDAGYGIRRRTSIVGLPAA